MPPRLVISHLRRPTAPPAPKAQPSLCLRCLLEALPSATKPRQTRTFTSTSPLEVARRYRGRARPVKRLTRMRRQMIAWINGPGAVFRKPRPGSTNYLGAYDRGGALIRERTTQQQNKGEDQDGNPLPKRYGAEDQENQNEEGNKQDDDDTKDEYSDIRAKNKNGQEGESGKKEGEEGEKKGDEGGTPKETVEDLQPFPLNRFFRSQPVLSEPLKDEIHKKISNDRKSIREVSVELGVTMERVSAVYRMKEIEKRRIDESKPLYLHYAHHVLSMLPQTPFNPSATKPSDNPRHETINDLPVHPSTNTQLFTPTSESRHFTRTDAGKAFHSSLLPAEQRIPHPQLVDAIRDEAAGYTQSERETRREERYEALERETQEKEERRRAKEEKRTKMVQGARWDFKFRDVSAETVGRKTGRSRVAPGWRYGQPMEDRKKGHRKIPGAVES